MNEKERLAQALRVGDMETFTKAIRAANTPTTDRPLREALRQIIAWCDASREDIAREHGSEQRLLLAVIPNRAMEALAEYRHLIEREAAALPPVAPDLDVETLAEALKAAHDKHDDLLVTPTAEAIQIAAEYRRLRADKGSG